MSIVNLDDVKRHDCLYKISYITDLGDGGVSCHTDRITIIHVDTEYISYLYGHNTDIDELGYFLDNNPKHTTLFNSQLNALDYIINVESTNSKDNFSNIDDLVERYDKLNNIKKLSDKL